MTRVVHARLDEESQRLLRRLCRRTGWRDSEVVRRGLRALADETLRERPLRLRGVGAVRSGLKDLASNKSHLRDFGNK